MMSMGEVEIDPEKNCIQRFDHRDVLGDPHTRLCLACWPPAPMDGTMTEENSTPRKDPS